MTRAFLHWRNGVQSLNRRASILDELLQFIRQGCVDQYGSHNLVVDFNKFETQVKSVIADSLLQAIQAKLPTNHKFGVETQAEYDEILDSFDSHSFVYKKSCYVVPPFRDEELRRQFFEKFECLKVSYGADYENVPDVEGAALCAIRNLKIALTRVVAFDVVCASADLQSLQFTDIRNRLYERLKNFSMFALLFSNLTGEEELRKSVTEMVVKNFVYAKDSHIQFSVIEHLHSDGLSPGIYKQAVEDSLVDSIRKSLK